MAVAAASTDTFSVLDHARIRVAGCAGALVAVLAAALAGQAPETGSISGHIRISRVRGTPLPSNVYVSRAVDRHDAPQIPEIRNVVVYLKDVAAGAPLRVSRQVIRQENESFVPRVLAITKGSTVEFPNADPFFHNVFSLSGGGAFDLGVYRQGDSRSVTFTKPGLVKVYCHIHSHMSASILVLDHPYFAIPADDGSFSIQGVPVGRYTLVGWHERVGERTTSINVEAGRPAEVSLTLPVEDAL